MNDEHVDIVKNEWLAGVQAAVARVSVEHGDLRVWTKDPKWDEIVRRPIHDPSTGETIYAEKDPQHFLQLLASAVASSYLFATPVHGMEACDFASGSVLSLKQADLREEAAR